LGIVGSCSPDGNHIYITDSSSDTIDALKAGDGSLEWQCSLLSELSWPVVNSSGLIYAHTTAPDFSYRYFYAINPDGSVKWTYDATGDPYSPQSIAVILGDLLVNSYHYIYRHAASDGHRVWTVSTAQAAGYSANISVDKNGHFYTADAQQTAPSLVNPRILFYDADGNLLKTVAMYPLGEIAIGDNRIYFVDWATVKLACLS
jgi:outer membrane protein assembly factor BamB